MEIGLVGQAVIVRITHRFHNDRYQHHGYRHSYGTNDHRSASTPCVHVEHVGPGEDVKHKTLNTIGEKRTLRLADTRLLEEEYSIVHDHVYSSHLLKELYADSNPCASSFVPEEHLEISWWGILLFPLQLGHNFSNFCMDICIIDVASCM